VKSWYLIHSKPHQERIARDQLERQGYETYLPFASVRRRRKGRSIRVIDPMFPRYLFIHLSNDTDDWRPIRSTIGVSTLVRFGNMPAQIPDRLIAELHMREDADGIQMLPDPEYRKGDRLRIAEGPLEGYEGIFQSQTGKERVLLLLEIAHQSVKIEIKPDQLESI
jgi:transcriptional antiterminator RfaH